MRVIAIIGLLFLSLHVQGQNYYIYVTAESEDEVALVRFDGKNAVIEKTIQVGFKPSEIEGPHGITVAPDGKHWFLSMAHGSPYGYLYKFATGSDELVGQTTLGLFPASMQISTLTGLLYCVNFNLHGDMVPSTVSVVDPVSMTEITQVTVGTMPHGSRITPDGKSQYSVGMMSGEVFEINTLSQKVSRVLALDETDHSKMDHSKMDHSKMDHSKMDHSKMDHSKMDHSNHEGMDHSAHKGMDHGKEHKMHHSATKPTWVTPHPINNKVYIAGNGSNEIIEVDLDEWKVTDRIPCGKGPYNIDITPDGKKLIVSYKSEAATGIWDLKKRKEVARIPNSRKVTHGVAVSTDSRYAFVSVEGIGGEPGSMDVIDLKSNKKVASVDMGKQAGGIAFWKQN